MSGAAMPSPRNRKAPVKTLVGPGSGKSYDMPKIPGRAKPSPRRDVAAPPQKRPRSQKRGLMAKAMRAPAGTGRSQIIDRRTPANAGKKR